MCSSEMLNEGQSNFPESRHLFLFFMLIKNKSVYSFLQILHMCNYVCARSPLASRRWRRPPGGGERDSVSRYGETRSEMRKR